MPPKQPQQDDLMDAANFSNGNPGGFMSNRKPKAPTSHKVCL
jgi:hypothetical protein